MQIQNYIHFLRKVGDKLDDRTLHFFRSHANLIGTLFLFCFAAWATSLHDNIFILFMLLLGAVGYFLGLTIGLACSSIMVVFLFPHIAGNIDARIAMTSLILVAYVSAVLLGYRHKQEKLVQAEQVNQGSHNPHVLPWAVANEIRTSLAAIRFLLFPVHDDNHHVELERAANELSRLEKMFTEMERKENVDPSARS